MKQIERVQRGLRIERRFLRVLKGLGEHLVMSVAELVEGMAPFLESTREKIAQLKQVYELDLTAADAHGVTEKETGDGA